MSLPDKREVERKTRLATVVVMGLFVLSAAETVAASHIAGRGSLRSKELVSIHLNLEMSAPTCAPTLTFIDQADRVLTATVGGTGYFVQDMTTGVCAGGGNFIVRLPVAGSYTVIVGPTGKRFGPVTFQQLRAHGWEWNVPA